MSVILVYLMGLIGVGVGVILFISGSEPVGLICALASVGASLAYGNMIEKKTSEDIFENAKNEIQKSNPEFEVSEYIHIKNESITDIVNGGGTNQYILLDKRNNELCIIQASDASKIRLNFIPAKDMIDSELRENQKTTSKTTTKTALGNQILRTAVGGVVLGGAGAIIGGVTAKQNSNTISTIELNYAEIILTVNSLDNPVYTFNFKNLLPIARRWQGIFSALIHNEEQRQGSSNNRTE